MGYIRNDEDTDQSDAGESGYACVLRDVGVSIFCKYREVCQGGLLAEDKEKDQDAVYTIYYLESIDGGEIT